MGKTCVYHQVVEPKIMSISAVLCPEMIPDGNLSASCNRHNLETCDFVCSPGYSPLVSSVQCIAENWNHANPCQLGTYLSYPKYLE